MPIIKVIFDLLIVGVVMWLVNSFIPMGSKVKKVINIAVVILISLWLLQLMFPSLRVLRIGH
jgi:hypothetical protein